MRTRRIVTGLVLLVAASLAGQHARAALERKTPMNETAQASLNTAESNKQIVRQAFEAWRNGTGGPFSLLAPDASWTITGNSLVARTYNSRQAFLDAVITPFNARLSKPLVPRVRGLYAEGDVVVALFEGEATTHEGTPYRNTYAWFMQMQDGKIGKVTAFFDSMAFDELWKGIRPRTDR